MSVWVRVQVQSNAENSCLCRLEKGSLLSDKGGLCTWYVRVGVVCWGGGGPSVSYELTTRPCPQNIICFATDKLLHNQSDLPSCMQDISVAFVVCSDSVLFPCKLNWCYKWW